MDIFAIGSDWEGYFDYLKEYCEVVYLPRTEGISSTQLREERPSVKVGIIGTGSIARRFVPESKVVNSIEIAAAYNPNFEHGAAFCRANEIPFAARTQAASRQNSSPLRRLSLAMATVFGRPLSFR